MSSCWTGSLVRLRGVEPGAWQTFKQFDEHTEHQRSVDVLRPPRSAEGYRVRAAGRATAEPVGDRFTEEGRLRDHEFFSGRHHDLVVMGMTALEFSGRHPFEEL
ncbi:hypothetical protein [Kitasatospora sp. NPDC057223]|uniref:hypothetical protein n=1 Tax=Kitasatospora sp. NPDC057223 TaxID=3346055 RepID=UPI0036337EE2